MMDGWPTDRVEWRTLGFTTNNLMLHASWCTHHTRECASHHASSVTTNPSCLWRSWAARHGVRIVRASRINDGPGSSGGRSGAAAACSPVNGQAVDTSCDEGTVLRDARSTVRPRCRPHQRGRGRWLGTREGATRHNSDTVGIAATASAVTASRAQPSVQGRDGLDLSCDRAPASHLSFGPIYADSAYPGERGVQASPIVVEIVLKAAIRSASRSIPGAG
jgi:hypothetical protein